MRSKKLEQKSQSGSLGKQVLPTTSDKRPATALRCLDHKIQRPRDVALQVLARDHGIQHSVFQKKLGALKTWRQLLPDRLLNHPGPGKANQSARFGDVEIAQHGK